MELKILRDCLRIIPNDSWPLRDERDTAYIEEVLGLKKEGDYVKLIRKNVYGTLSLGCLETEVVKVCYYVLIIKGNIYIEFA